MGKLLDFMKYSSIINSSKTSEGILIDYNVLLKKYLQTRRPVVEGTCYIYVYGCGSRNRQSVFTGLTHDFGMLTSLLMV